MDSGSYAGVSEGNTRHEGEVASGTDGNGKKALCLSEVMRKQSDSGNSLHWLHDSRWAASVLSVFLLAIVGVLDYVTGKELSFTLLYLVPVFTAVWFLDRRAGFLMCVAAAATSMATELFDHGQWLIVLWNTGIRFGVYLVFCTLLAYIKSHRIATPVFHRLNRTVVVAVVLACVLAAASGLVQMLAPNFVGTKP